MLAVKSMNIRDNFKSWCDEAIKGETIIISRPQNKNVVMISESEYNKLKKAQHNADYLAMLERSRGQLERGEVVIKSMEELENMANE
ncbi:MAG: type II toxin-antitoxin system Phd/YefM family antitoxin [Clostridiales bacterium]|nr:type II toxin-antitoxin system Phd/YefM family antitoxin [Clostridiales bacterium]